MSRTSDDDEEPRSNALPERLITANMLIGFNLTRWRRAAGMTQDQLGSRLGGWTKTAVSAAERSWDGKRVRQFDADLVVRLSGILGVPVQAFFLPPPDDGDAFRYVIRAGGGDVMTMREYFAIVMPGAGDDSSRMYLDVAAAAAAKYLDPAAAGMLAETVKSLAAEKQLTDALRAVRANSRALAAFTASLESLTAGNALLYDVLRKALDK